MTQRRVNALALDVWDAVHAAGAAGLTIRAIQQQLSDRDADLLRAVTGNLKAGGYLAQLGGRGSAYTAERAPARGDAAELVPATAKRATVANLYERAMASSAKAPADAPLSERLQQLQGDAMERIRASAAGLDSEQLAAALGSSPFEVDDALAPEVRDHSLVTCTVIRDGVRLMQYRVSVGAVSGAERQVTWAARAAKTSTCADVASEVCDPAPPPPPPPPAPPRGIPFAGELDIDAADRTAAAREGRRLPGDADWFDCHLSLRGVLHIHSAGERLTLPVDKTRQLLRYLDGLHGEQIVADALRAAA